MRIQAPPVPRSWGTGTEASLSTTDGFHIGVSSCEPGYWDHQVKCERNGNLITRSRLIPRWGMWPLATVLVLAVVATVIAFFLSPSTISKYAGRLDQAHQYGLGGIIRKLACARGDGTACEKLGFMYARGDGVAKDYSRAIALFSKACDARNAEGCAGLGAMYLFGLGVTKDDLRAKALFSKGCDQAIAISCRDLGMWYLSGRGGNRYRSSAASYLSKARNASDAAGCGSLGLM